MVRWLCVSLFGFFSGGLFIAFYLKHKRNWKFQFWWLNDTEDGDYGNEKWLKDNGYKKGLWSAINWWRINHSWNYIRGFIPGWKDGEADIFKTIYSTVTDTEKYGRWTRADKRKGIYGLKFIAYQIDGKTYCQFSYANKWISIQLGGGSEYRFRIKL
jgi:hypothetical protein